MSLSIVVPVLDEAEVVAEALAELNRQRAAAAADFPGGIELLVADGGSSDDTLARCAGLADGLIAAPRGRARQMNAGAAQAVGAVLLFLHVDTRLPPDGLAALARVLAAQPERPWGRFDVRIAGRSRMLPVVAALMNLRSAWSGIATGDQAIFVWRASFEAVGGFPDQPLMEDIELSRRLRRLPGGHPLRLRQRVTTSGRRWDSRGAWTTIVLMWRLRWAYWRGVPAERLAEAYR